MGPSQKVLHESCFGGDSLAMCENFGDEGGNGNSG